jgi:pentatricopeptide repeat protein
MMQMTVPQSVSQNIARARSLIQRNEISRALDCLFIALDNYDPGNLIGKARFEVGVHLQHCIDDINHNPKVHNLLVELAHSSDPNIHIHYTPGEETALRAVLNVLHKALENMELAETQGAQQARKQRKAELLEHGRSLLAAGEGVKAKVELRRLAEEFGKEPGIYAQVGAILAQAKMPADAVEFLELAVEASPKDGQSYSTLVDCYMTAMDYEKAAVVYEKALRQFGQHPRTLAHLAKVYKLLNKRDKAAAAAQQALSLDPGNAEAQEIAASIR